MNGTSMATSHVSGSIALLLALRPDLKSIDIKKRLRRTAKPLQGSTAKAKSTPTPGEVHAGRLIRGRLVNK
ncbi:hypothetical protein D3C77_681110 [compost metagenome]